jgi:hypothetical protein
VNNQKLIRIVVEFISNPSCGTPMADFPTPILEELQVSWKEKKN